ncbi:MAG: hypothetical protein ACXVNF_14890 [Neobacillus sp.]
MKSKKFKSLFVAGTLLFSQITYSQENAINTLWKVYHQKLNGVASIQNQISRTDTIKKSIELTDQQIANVKAKMDELTRAMKDSHVQEQQKLLNLSKSEEALEKELDNINKNICVEFADKCQAEGVNEQSDAISKINKIRAALEIDVTHAQKEVDAKKDYIINTDPRFTKVADLLQKKTDLEQAKIRLSSLQKKISDFRDAYEMRNYEYALTSIIAVSAEFVAYSMTKASLSVYSYSAHTKAKVALFAIPVITGLLFYLESADMPTNVDFQKALLQLANAENELKAQQQQVDADLASIESQFKSYESILEE